MSEYINNREHRQDVLKRLIRKLHEGQDLEEVKEEFRNLLQDVSATEISQMEQALIAEGLPAEQIQELCDVHVQVFRESLDKQAPPGMTPGHPVHTFRAENEAVRKVVEELKQRVMQIKSAGALEAAAEPVQHAQETLSKLMQLDTHYLRKENLLFPYLEKYGVTGPSSVMWGIHDQVRAQLKELRGVLETYAEYDYAGLVAAIERVANPLTTAITEMIYKEENILFPMALEKLSDTEWLAIVEQSPEVGYCLIEPPDARLRRTEEEPPSAVEGRLGKMERAPSALPLDTGSMTPEEVNLVLRNLPIDITFVDKDDTVRYFSQSKDRIFVRAPAIIGRKVQNCHPPASVHVVNRIVEDFKQGRREVAEFWIQMQGKFVHIRYFPLRDENGEYVGTIEVTQDVTPIRELTGERRLLEEE